ncbi:phosphatase PAP2 family protein [Clostridium sp. MSJ-8]|uniref:phosphatase PAP2 family protein n=1 Tax=Clostridium sp. MSJ-8 TaxID=2841510 RepID=UPI0034614715
MGVIQSFDFSILDYIRENLSNSLLDNVMPLFTHLGDAGIIWIIITVYLLIIKKYRKYGVIMLLALGLDVLVCNVLLKELVGRARPFEVRPYIDIIINKPKDPSFPSGHTAIAFAAASVLCYMDRRTGIFAIIIASIIAFSRLYLYVHYPTDVLAGIIVGILCGVVAIKIYKKFIGKI